MKKMWKSLVGLLALLVGLSLIAGCENGTTEVQQIDKTYEADIVVVGGGGAGFSAALTALQADKKVIIVEQLAYTGGNTLFNGGGINAAYVDDSFRIPGSGPATPSTMSEADKLLVENKINMRAGDATYANLNFNASDVSGINAAMAPWQTRLQSDWNTWKSAGQSGFFDSPYLHMLQTYEGGDFIAKPELVEKYALNCVSAWRWLVAQGATDTIDTAPSQIVGSLYYRCHMAGWTGASVDNAPGGSGVGFIRPQERQFVDGGGTRLVEHQAKKIVMNGNKAVGIIGTFPGGVFEVKAKAVIMATGGFGGNWEMLEQYQPNKLANYNPHDQEIKWANIKNYSTTNSISAATGEGLIMARAIGASLYQMDQIQLLPGSNTGPGSNLADTIYVNELGNRIVNESGRRDELSLSYIAQVKRNPESGSSWAVSGNPSGAFWGPAPTAYSTIEDLGTAILTANNSLSTSALNTFVTGFTAAVQNYNESFLNPQTVTDYAGKLLKNQTLTAPWYYTAVARPYIHHTMGGIEINENGEVLNTSGDVIPGLYAAGECVGGLHGANRIGGNAVGDIIVFGRLAGTNAAAYVSN